MTIGCGSSVTIEEVPVGCGFATPHFVDEKMHPPSIFSFPTGIITYKMNLINIFGTSMEVLLFIASQSDNGSPAGKDGQRDELNFH